MAGASPYAQKPPTIKFLCSYGGRILPRYPDGNLRYYGGHTRLLAVSRSISFSELMMKLCELCGKTVKLRCQLPTEDLDALVCITSDEDLANLIEEYDRTPCLQYVKIRAFLSTPNKCSSTASDSGSGSSSSSSSSTGTPATSPKSPFPTVRFPNPCIYTPFVKVPVIYNKSAGKLCCYGGYMNHNPVPNGKYWQ
ncbi:hypothetical protein QVD17_35588 [Tagetes erecta]|uniref:PB1 domain-containing protein n=1 Tax=Tagetes erecta TaxID=13708 RepID=A0AAD8NF88_TARER|nr:hypothetical protein QVD17_35588 [Tagetes erecta]